MPEESPVELPRANHKREEYVPPTLWQENHGTFLTVFVLAIFCIGAVVLAYQQNRFQPPSFPDGSMIDNVNLDESVQADDVVPTLRIAVEGATNDRGNMVLIISEGEDPLLDPEQALVADVQKIEFGSAKWEVPLSVLPEKFAIMAFHDENEDGIPNRRKNIVTERFGMSNDARSLGEFREAVIARPESDTTIEIVVR